MGRVLTLCFIFALSPIAAAEMPARVGVFEVDASPPIGSPLAYDPTNEILIPLSCRGIVLLGADKPIVICAVDWIGIGNAAHREFREALAKAAGTTADHVAVHVLHQHDAPWCDFSVDELLEIAGVEHRPFDSAFAKETFARAAAAAAKAIRDAQPITHLGLSSATVEKVASNRRILGPDGKVQHVRWSAIKDAAVREFPEGVIDPQLRMIGLWNGEKPVVALTYYATHPQSYYRTGKANPDFPGIARNQRQQKTGVPHIHLNGAGGNVTAGKYNDGAVANRQALADRMAAAMERAWQETKKTPLAASQIGWKTLPVKLPAARQLDEQALTAALGDKTQPVMKRFMAANKLVWLRRAKANDTIDISCLSLDAARVLHMPGELFVEYQLEAQRLRPDLFVAMAAYGDYAPAYIGTAISYSQGGYETGEDASFVGPEAEPILLGAIAKLLDVKSEMPRALP